MALSAGQIIHLDQPLSSEVASLIYLWADNIKRSVIIRNRSLAKIKPALMGFVSSGIPIFVHRQRPCLWATTAGIVVGVSPKDRKWEYMIDDGTQIIDVTIHERDIPEGVAPPPTSSRASSSRWTLDAPEPDMRIGDLVRVTGKIWRRKRHRQLATVGLDAVQVELLNVHSTAEVQHNLLAHDLEQGEYNRPFGVLSGSGASASSNQAGLMDLDGDVVSLRYRTSGLRSYQRLTVGPLPENSEVSIESGAPGHSDDTTGTLTSPPKRQRDRLMLDRQDRDNTVPEQSTSIRKDEPSLNRLSSRTRSLRAPSRLSDSECTPSLFRLHVQKILTDHCGDAASETDSPPPAFSLSFLRRVKPLAELSDRIVSILLHKRAQKLAARSASRKNLSGDAAEVQQPLSSEPKREKIKRLFEWCIRELLVDGFVVIAAHQQVEVIRSPFDGRHRDVRSGLATNGQSKRNHKLRKLTMILDDADPHDDDSNTTQEAYQLVTPNLLRPTIHKLAERQSRTRLHTTGNPSTMLQLLKRTDERWKHVTLESVEEAMTGS